MPTNKKLKFKISSSAAHSLASFNCFLSSFEILKNFSKSIWQLSCFVICLLCLFSSNFCFPPSSQIEPAAVTSSREDRLAIFDEVWQTINERYYDSNLRGVNWVGLRSAFRTRAAETTDSAAFYRLLRSMIGELRDSHTRIYAPSEKIDWRNPRVISVGVSVRGIENELVVVNVEKDSLPESAGLRAGDVITQIDGVAAKTVFARKLIEQRGSSTLTAGRLKAAASILEGPPDSIVNVRWRNARGRERSADFKRDWRELSSTLRVRRVDNVLIIAFDAFVPETVGEFFRVLSTEIYNARGIVLDLRQNRGGSAEAMADVAAAFLPSNYGLGKFIDRNGNVAVEAQTHSWLLFAPNLVQAQNVPVVVLTSTATASAAEIFTAALKSANRAQSVGTTTCGCVLAIRRQHALPDGGVLEISELDFQMPGGKRLEGVGVTPNSVVQLTRTDVRQKRDKALNQAFAILNDKK